jgi:hypothetical protein
LVLSHFKWVTREEIHRNSPLIKGVRGLFENPLQSRIKTTSKRTQETRCSIRGSALESAKIQGNAWLAIYETEAARKLYC